VGWRLVGQAEIIELMNRLSGQQKFFTVKEISVCLDQSERGVRRSISVLVNDGVLERVVTNSSDRKGVSVSYRFSNRYENIVGDFVGRVINFLRI